MLYVNYLEVVTCSNLTWSVLSLLFAAVNCGTLTNPANGQVSHTTGATFGQTVTYSCDTGYNLVGDSNRTCQAAIRFLAGITKLVNIPPVITKISRRWIKSSNTNLLYFLFEAKDISIATRTLGSHEMVVRSPCSWTPLDYYVTGHAISHSNCRVSNLTKLL